MQVNINHKPIRSFVSRQRTLTPTKQKIFDELWPIYGIDHEALPTKLNNIFNKSSSITMEIGFGMGESLLQMAINEANATFVGIEVHHPGVANLIANLKKHPVANLHIIEADALEVFAQSIPDNSIDRVLIFFPDPWPKRKQQKRRLLRPDFIAILQQKLKPGGILHFATDWEEYAKSTLKLFAANNHWQNLAGENKFSPRPNYRPQTKFETRGLKFGHKIWDLLWERL